MKFYHIIVISLITILTVSCAKDSDDNITVIKDYPISTILTGHEVDFDSISGIPGCVSIMGDNLLFFQYESDNLIMETDSSFTPLRYIFPIGQGPNEMIAISGDFGDIIGNNSIGAFDPFSYKIVEYRHDDFTKYITHKFDNQLKEYSPRCAIRLQSGEYVSLKGLNQFGIVAFDSCGNNIHEWPVGLNIIDNSTIRANHVISSVRDMSYNSSKKIIGEIYGVLPYIILHNLDGSINSVLKIGNGSDISSIDEYTPKIINSLRLTDNNIYALCNHPDNEEKSVILIIDYYGNGVARLEIDQAYSFCIDIRHHRIVTVNPNAEYPVRVYSLSDIIANP